MGTVFDIQRFSTHDGYGIRTTIFLKGCNNRCAWCHNPEGLSSLSQLQFFQIKCIGCGKCVQVCKTSGVADRSLCINCGACANICPTGAREMSGIEMSVYDVYEKIKVDNDFYLNTGGGVTFSGGEPLLQADFITEIAKLCKKDGISVGIQTAGNVPYEYFEKILPYTDFIMCDMKIFNDVMHQKYVGTSNKLILKNMERLSNENIKLIIRTPVISRINEDDIEDICKYIKDFENLAYYELLKYHKLGLSKLENLNINSCIEFEPPTDEKLKELFFAAKKIIKNVKCIAIEEI